MNKRIAINLLLAICILFLVASTTLADGGNYSLNWWTVDGGGSTFRQGGGYTRHGTIGQFDASVWSGGEYVLAGGFWGYALSWTLLGIGGALLEPAYSSLIARGVPQKVRGITYGLVATSLGIFTLPFPWIGGQIWASFGAKVPFLLTVMLGSLALIPAWTKLIPGDEREVDEPLETRGVTA